MNSVLSLDDAKSTPNDFDQAQLNFSNHQPTFLLELEVDEINNLPQDGPQKRRQ